MNGTPTPEYLNGLIAEGRRTNFFWHPFCRINAAFHLATERRIYAAAKNCVVRPQVDPNHRWPGRNGSTKLWIDAGLAPWTMSHHSMHTTCLAVLLSLAVTASAAELP